jgi:hypothetical protein
MLAALSLKDHVDAAAELVTITVISVLPLILGGLIRWLQLDNFVLSFASYGGAFDTFLVHGELFLYALAFIATIAWTALKEWPPGLRPPRVVFGLFCFLSISMITLFFSFDTARVALHIEGVLTISKVMFALTLVFYYFATLLSKVDAPDVAAALSESSDALASKLSRGRHADG